MFNSKSYNFEKKKKKRKILWTLKLLQLRRPRTGWALFLGQLWSEGKAKWRQNNVLCFPFITLLMCFSLPLPFPPVKDLEIFSPGISPYLLWGVAFFSSIPLIHFPPLPVFHTSEEIQRHCFSSAGWECQQGTGPRALCSVCSLIPKHFSALGPVSPGDCPACWGQHHPSEQGFHQGSQVLKVLCWNVSRRFSFGSHNGKYIYRALPRKGLMWHSQTSDGVKQEKLFPSR